MFITNGVGGEADSEAGDFCEGVTKTRASVSPIDAYAARTSMLHHEQTRPGARAIRLS